MDIPDELLFGYCPTCGAFLKVTYSKLETPHRSPGTTRFERARYCTLRLLPIVYRLHPSSQRLVDFRSGIGDASLAVLRSAPQPEGD